jgi:hypothetical protein
MAPQLEQKLVRLELAVQFFALLLLPADELPFD